MAFLDEAADRQVRGLRQRLREAGVRSAGKDDHRFAPYVAFGAGAAIPARARAAVRAELALLALPSMWLSTLATFPTTDNVLVLAAIVDTELLAVHSAVHDALAGAVRQPSAQYLPGSWVPHCRLAERVSSAELATGFAALHPVTPIQATLGAVGVLDTATSAVELLWQR